MLDSRVQHPQNVLPEDAEYFSESFVWRPRVLCLWHVCIGHCVRVCVLCVLYFSGSYLLFQRSAQMQHVYEKLADDDDGCKF